ncbi:hypothetical protein SELR_19920 [Selenomonas ruminantium subsp. lactilytica TAM6421]|uniref:Uncharacterized protein n=2 Tax=Selenomonas ruminantium TaxID=971 RepID=I0GSG3_SELRL|nr:hypothetical protein SELR_19920 [Selenomonas ruminantium subsp. lactilytica TAM6421]
MYPLPGAVNITVMELLEEYHGNAADGWQGDDSSFEERKRRKVRALGSEPGTNHKACQGLDENHEIETVVEQVAKAASTDKTDNSTEQEHGEK